MQTLHLTVTKEWFNLILAGEKKEEYRKKTQWIVSRLWKITKEKWSLRTGQQISAEIYKNRHYDQICFVNGYGNHRPFIIVEFLEHLENLEPWVKLYSNGSTVQINRTDLVIRFGKIIETGNLENLAA